IAPRRQREFAQQTTPQTGTPSKTTDISKIAASLRSSSTTSNTAGDGTGGGSGGGTGTSSGTSSGQGSGKKVAAGPRQSGVGTQLDFADCVKCEVEYPERAKERGIEGKPEIAFDVDNNGNPINVRLVRSSGHKMLDEALLAQARKFKLNSAAAGKENVRLTANFALEGTRTHREAMKRQREREEKRRQAQEARKQAEVEQKKREAANNESEEGSERRQRRMLEPPSTPLIPSNPSTPSTPIP
ncbi:MAG: energy transducer TonB, partial [Scytonema sp. PMC 1070.18]|nr:energy transducer TonB [Scytonema sp. PMC 1070.18]